MAWPQGNQYAAGSTTNGRDLKYDEEYIKKEAQLLLDWSLKETSLSLYRFTDEKEYCAEDLSRFAKKCDDFYQALKKAKNRISIRREEACNKGKLNFGVWTKTANIYDRLKFDHDEEDKDREMKRQITIEEEKFRVKEESELRKGIPPGQSIINNLYSQGNILPNDKRASVSVESQASSISGAVDTTL